MPDNRELVPLEQAMEVLNRVAGSYNVVTISRIKGALSQAIVRQALDLIQHRHPRLNSRIVGSLDSLRFETLRRRIKPSISNDNLAILTSSLISFHTLQTNTSFWELARDVRRQVEVGLERGDIFIPVQLSRKIIESFLARSHKSPATTSVTNVGQVNIPSVYGSFTLEEISFIAAQAAFGGIVSVAVTTFKGKMFLNFMFSEPSISRDTAEKIANGMVNFIAEACQ